MIKPKLISHLRQYINKLVEEYHFSLLFVDVKMAAIGQIDLQADGRVLHILQVL